MASHYMPGTEGCQWPMWEDGAAAGLRPTFCDAARAVRPDGCRLPYCAAHCVVAYVPRRTQQAAAVPFATDRATGMRADGASQAPENAA